MALVTQDDGPIRRRLELHKDWRYDIPLKFLWAVYIYPKTSRLNELGENIKSVIDKYETINSNQWPVNTRGLTDVMDRFGTFGILLAQNIALPSDSFDISNTMIEGAGGRLGGQYSGNRQGYGSSNKVDITFLETNIDIFDYFIKPWIIANSYKGLIEDGTGKNELKCDLQLIQFSRDAYSYRNVIGAGASKGPFELSVRKVIEFYDATPFQINGDQLSYGDLGMNDVTKTVSFSFNKYAVVSNNLIPGSNKFNTTLVSGVD
jgi:hypothetical protein